MTRDELQLLLDINRHFRHLQLSTYEVQREVKDLEKIICSARRCIDEKSEGKGE
jgi:cell division protein FtsL